MGAWNVQSENVFISDSDPGAVGAGAIWSDTNANITYRRNDLNTDWISTTIALGTAYQNLSANSDATAQTYQASLQSLMTAQADIVYASAANTPVRLAKGTAAQVLQMNAGATAPAWATLTSPLELIETYDFDGVVTTKTFATDFVEATYSAFMVVYGGRSGTITLQMDGDTAAYFSETTRNGVANTTRTNASDIYLMVTDVDQHSTFTLWVSAQAYAGGHMIGQSNVGVYNYITSFGLNAALASAGTISELKFSFDVAPQSTANITLYGLKRV